MPDDTSESHADTDLPELCSACLDRQKRFKEDDSIRDKGFMVGRVNDGKCDRCTFCELARGENRAEAVSLQDIPEHKGQSSAPTKEQRPGAHIVNTGRYPRNRSPLFFCYEGGGMKAKSVEGVIDVGGIASTVSIQPSAFNVLTSLALLVFWLFRLALRYVSISGCLSVFHRVAVSHS